ncbi:uncharacterized protein LACBIDRAFT_318829 [Laccaria bicolor S238N-H82]|uniref:Predicted protein n=1 Tax=Laccaria bicolor (strain S238N-H82 / ATCC MYA-4686) TaxID=486041 RepID=B0D768_LACBS|nr:uncharacterized protein LACBIDRAFT_318829 [Laccaria bicolor S238N-H82]EDR09343.1 predicted protein [Laccaria bicolor S238N-H82]|eukprot:XP_001879692.1 predicted protein [Laccaria bicolor S238N-H82]
MGIPGIWEILCKAMQTRSLTELAFSEGFDTNWHGVQTLTIGVDVSIWLNQMQAVFHVPGMHYQVGENRVLHNLFYHIARFPMKQGINVRTKAHALTNSFQELIEQYGYSSHTALGEAEAELAMLNSQQIIDGVLSDDADTLLFRATHLIQNPTSREMAT